MNHSAATNVTCTLVMLVHQPLIIWSWSFTEPSLKVFEATGNFSSKSETVKWGPMVCLAVKCEVGTPGLLGGEVWSGDPWSAWRGMTHMFTPLFLPSSSVSLYLFRSCCSHAPVFGKALHLCLSSPFAIAILSGACYSEKRNNLLGLRACPVLAMVFWKIFHETNTCLEVYSTPFHMT